MSEGTHPGSKPRVGVSACLLGQSVRYDGGHKRDRYITDVLGRFFEWVPVCPEVECGLPIPRESMRLEGEPEAPRLMTSRTRVDHTQRMLDWVHCRLDELAVEGLNGFIFKSKSPSSGMVGVRVYDASGMPSRSGSGLFAKAFMERFPLLPVEDEGRLHDAGLRENFVERIFCLKRYRDYRSVDGGIGGLVEFHACHKLQLMAHSPELQRRMGRLVAGARAAGLAECLTQYEELLMRALSEHATPGKNTNVLQHMLGYFRDQLSADEKQEMLTVIEGYRTGNLPLIVPVVLMWHYVRKYRPTYLLGQTYIEPHPIELQLRNHA